MTIAAVNNAVDTITFNSQWFEKRLNENIIDIELLHIMNSDTFISISSFKREQVKKQQRQVINPQTTNKKKKKIGVNDPCPCGSGLKFKKCKCEEYHK